MNLRGAPERNSVNLTAGLFSDEAKRPTASRWIGIASGPRFETRESQNRWHDLEVIVTPANVTARWNGQSFSVPTAEIQRRVHLDLEMTPPPPTGPLPPGLRPKLETRGGLGLFISRGTAAFRRVTLTPLRPHRSTPLTALRRTQ